MIRRFVILGAIVILYCLWSALSMTENVGDDKAFVIRHARGTDVDEIANVTISVFDQSHIYSYRYTKAKEYPEDYATFTKVRTAEYLANVESGAYIGMVAEAVEGKDRKKVVVGYSFWQLAGWDSRTGR